MRLSLNFFPDFKILKVEIFPILEELLETIACGFLGPTVKI
jgi:hypothetical protein